MNVRAKKITAGVAALLLVTICMVTVLFLRQRVSPAGMKIEKNVVEWNQTIPVKNSTGQESIKMPYYGDITMRAEQKSVGVTLVNPKENNCYFVYELFLHDTGERIYTSDLLEPGKAIDGIQSERAVKKGIYDLDIKIMTYSLAQQQPMNNAVVNTKLIVG